MMERHIATAAGVFAIVAMLAAPAAAQSGGDRSKGRVETQAQCEARQQKMRDPVSGIRIQSGDAGRFCNRQRSKR